VTTESSGSNPFYCGGQVAYTGLGYWNIKSLVGLIDELVIFRDVLSKVEMQAIRNGTYPQVVETPFEAHFTVETVLTADLTVINVPPLMLRPQLPVRESLEWLTEIIKAFEGTEQRIAKRRIPRQTFAFTYELLTDEENARVDAMLHSRLKQTWAVPVWTEYVDHAADLTAGATIISLTTAYADFRNASYGLIWQSKDYFEILHIATVAAESLTLSRGLVNNFTGDKLIMPLRTGYVLGSTRKQVHPTALERLEITYAILDNETALTSAAGTFHGWSGDLTGTDNPDTITMNENKEVTAHFLSAP